jgi:histone deacetylase complex regulatory component SIN3
VRTKNIYEIELNKCEDERYEFDVVINKFRKTKEILEKVVAELKT